MANVEVQADKDLMLDLSEDQKILFLKLLLHLSKVDGYVDDHEIKFIKKAARKYHVENLQKIFETITEEELLEEAKHLNNRRISLELIKELCRLSHADNNFGDEEVIFISRLGQVLGINIEKIEQISNWVIDYLVWQEQGKIIFEE